MTGKKSRGLFSTEKTEGQYFIRWIDGRVEKCICTDAVMHVRLVEGLLEQAGYRRSTADKTRSAVEKIRALFNRRSERYFAKERKK
jgi:hypothetical protein